MKNFSLIFLLIFGAGLAGPGQTDEIYKTVDENGNITFTDSAPDSDTEPVSLPDLNIQQSVTPKVRLSPNDAPGLAPIQVWIASPEQNKTINPGALSFSVDGGTNRALAETEYAQLLVNGSPYGNQSKVLRWSIGNLIRGEYSVQIQILSEGSVMATSGTHVVFIQRAFVR